MSRIIITGDTHGSVEMNRLSFKNFPEGHSLTKNDYVIITGDFGAIWDGTKTDEYWLDFLEDKPFTTLFCDGNHENFNLLYNYPVEEWNDGKIHVIRPSVYHLMRGQIFTIDNKKFFVMGGATSIDKGFRKENESWWSQEIPSVEEFDGGIINLEANNYKVDYIITHCLPDSLLDVLYCGYNEHDLLTNYLEHMVARTTTFKNWFCGHYHTDKIIHSKFYVCYHDFYEITDNGIIKIN